MSYTLQNPFISFVDANKPKPVGLGKLFVGLPDTDPELSPVNVYAVQPDGSELLLSQPITLTTGGVASFNGNPVQLRIDAETVSIKVEYASGEQSYYTAQWSPSVDAKDLAEEDSKVLIAGVEAGKLAKSTTLVTPKSWGILCNGTDETSKWQSLITYCAANRFGIGSFSGSTLITSQLLFPAGFGGIYGDSQLYMVFEKGFNGDIFSSNSQGAVYQNFWIRGNGSTYSGGGIYCVSDNVQIKHVRIEDTQDSPIICKSSQSVFLFVEDCQLAATDIVNTPSIRSDGADFPASPTVRTFNKITGSFYPLDCSGMNDFSLTNSLFSKLVFNANTSKGKFSLNRITAIGNNILVQGSDNVFSNNVVTFGAGFDLTISGDNNYFDGSNIYIKGSDTKACPIVTGAYGGALNNSVTAGIIDKSAQLSLNGSTSNWTRGDASVTAYAKLDGMNCLYTAEIVVGGTTVEPVGIYQLTAPFKSLVTYKGSLLIRTSTGTYLTGTCQIQGGDNFVTMWLDGLPNAVSSGSFSFGLGAIIGITIEFVISPS